MIPPPKTIVVDIDNPLRDTIEVNMDGLKAYKILPFSKEVTKIKAGKHTFDTRIRGKIVHSGYFDSSMDGLINATKSEYVVWKDIYMKEEKEEYYDNIKEEVVVIDGREFIGDIKYYNASSIFIPKEWDYGVRDKFPEFVDLGKSPYVIKKKIYYKEDFIREYNQ